MSDRWIRVHGARTHNLRDLDLRIPRDAWTVVAGVSGSGKSSLVLDTLGAESRRRFLGTLARGERGLEALPRPDVDRIEGLPPAVVAGFSSRAPGPRETLGTLTEVTHALRALFMRLAVPHCPRCGRAVRARGREAVLAELLAEPEGTRVVLLAPRGRGPAGLAGAQGDGFVRVRVAGGPVRRVEEVDAARVAGEDAVEVVVDRLVVRPDARERFAASVEQAMDLGEGVVRALVERPDGERREDAFAGRPHCASCGTTHPPLTTSAFSSASPAGACPRCEGRGRVPAETARRARTPGRRRPGGDDEGMPCPACDGERLAPYPRAARLAGLTLPGVERLTATEAARWLAALPLEGGEGALAAPARDDAVARLTFVEEVGLGYLALGRAADTLSGGEARRARLAASCAARMSGLLFLLDEPTAGLHPAERPPLRRRLRALVAEGNTVVCVEHDPETLRHADWILELGPGAGAAGGRLLAAGAAADVLRDGSSPAAAALLRPAERPRRAPRRVTPQVRVRGAAYRTLRHVDVAFPSAGLTCVTGLSGAGKTTLVMDVIAPAARAALEGRPPPPDRCAAVEGFDAFDRVAAAGAGPARHPRATAGGVLGVLAPLREVFAATLEARARGWGAARFSTQVPGGRCEACRGTGEHAVALRDLPEVRVPCEVCGGRRFAAETDRVRVKGFSMADVLALPLERGAEAFRDLPRVGPPLRAATDVGLGYVLLGDPTTRLSGGEALRLRLAAALGRGGRTRTLFLLDEPAAGLHPDDVRHLRDVLLRLAAEGNAVVCVEHHPDFVAVSDHVLLLGPGPGEAGGRLLHSGPPAGLPDLPPRSP